MREKFSPRAWAVPQLPKWRRDQSPTRIFPEFPVNRGEDVDRPWPATNPETLFLLGGKAGAPYGLSELDRTTLVGVLARYNTLFLRNKKCEDLKKHLDLQIAEGIDAMQRLHSAMKIYCFDTESGDWKRLQFAIGIDRYLDALDIGRVAVGLPVLDREPIIQAFADRNQA